MNPPYSVAAQWDAEAGVYISDSNIPGLVIETETVAEFEVPMNVLAPEMMAENVGPRDARAPVRFRVSATREAAIA